MFIAVSALSALAAHAEDRLLLKSVNVDLPVGDRMFEGPGSDVANNNCLACHSAGMVLFQPALSQAQWDAEVEKMRTAYKAPIDPKDVDTITAYLVSIRVLERHRDAVAGHGARSDARAFRQRDKRGSKQSAGASSPLSPARSRRNHLGM
jgi:hypothetical protein